MNKGMKFLFQNFEGLLASVFIVITTVLVLINVFLRYVMNTGLIWSEEVATGCFVWAVFIGATACYRKKMHVGVDIIINMMPKKVKKVICVLVDLILVVLNGYITYLTFLYLQTSYRKPTPILGVSSVYISASILISFFLMFVYSIVFLYQDIKAKEKEEVL